ncbi:Uncharacterised protein [BD1-7 clade bacterium]|uniref:Uncharacterized protein n=1 Tax=BD1-7 clade bacterium TaxID=2029982 RepID=A0A5S9QXS2_9GAMM|nr:Uncharacterised protein [BD1-7 clade bacterium]
MKRLHITTVTLLLICTQAFALDAEEQRYVQLINEQGVRGIKEASKYMYKYQEDHQQVLDQLAEQLILRAPAATKHDIDGLAWATKALSQSGNRRYYTMLKQIAESDAPKKLRKYAQKAYKTLKEPEGEQYQRGMAEKIAPAAKSTVKHGEGTFSDIARGMTLEEVKNRLGEPDTWEVYKNRKKWAPYSYKGGDTVRQKATYDGQGQIIFSNTDRYSDNYIVSEIIPK